MRKNVFLSQVFTGSVSSSAPQSSKLPGFSSRSSRRGRVSKAVTVMALVAGLVLTPAVSASAVRWERQLRPVMGGTELVFPHGNRCTAGFVVKKRGFFANLTAYRRATRFVVTAGHCGNVGDHVKVGGTDVGLVSWKRETADMMMIRVLPVVTRRSHCRVGSYHELHCFISQRSEPRAVGRVLTYSHLISGFGSIPITGYRGGVPNDVERFCTSGITTGVNCTWRKMELPIREILYSGQHGGISDRGVQQGDSGGPVYSSTGTLYGTISTELNSNTMTYISAGQFMFETNSNYSLAPS